MKFYPHRIVMILVLVLALVLLFFTRVTECRIFWDGFAYDPQDLIAKCGEGADKVANIQETCTRISEVETVPIGGMETDWTCVLSAMGVGTVVAFVVFVIVDLVYMRTKGTKKTK